MGNKSKILKYKLHRTKCKLIDIVADNVRLKKEAIQAKKELEEYKKHNLNFKNVWDAYYPVIASCRQLRKHYAGDNKHKQPLVMPDPAGRVMISLRAAELQYNIILQTQETNNAKKEIEIETKEPSSD